MADIIQGSKFEKDFIERAYASIVSDMPIAFSESVANSWNTRCNSRFYNTSKQRKRSYND